MGRRALSVAQSLVVHSYLLIPERLVCLTCVREKEEVAWCVCACTSVCARTRVGVYMYLKIMYTQILSWFSQTPWCLCSEAGMSHVQLEVG